MTAYACPVCGAISHNPFDLRGRYCGRCHTFADDVPAAAGLGPVDGGWRVKTSGDRRVYVDVVAELDGWLLVTRLVDHPDGWVQGWRYDASGIGPDGVRSTMESAFRVAVAAARAWDGADGTAPDGYDGEVLTGRA